MPDSTPTALTPALVQILRKIPTQFEDARAIAQKAGIDYSSLMSAVSSLEEEGLVEVTREEKKSIVLTSEGESYLNKGTPERRLFATVQKNGGNGADGGMALDAAYSAAGLLDSEKGIALQWAKRNGWLDVAKSSSGASTGTSGAPVFRVAKAPDEKTLFSFERALAQVLQKAAVADIAPSDLSLMLSRKLAAEKTEKSASLRATAKAAAAISDAGKTLSGTISVVTPELLRTKAWKGTGKAFERYDPLAPSPVVYPGKKQPLRAFIDEIRDVFLQMGFVEIKGPIVEASFWNFDALYVPQDHPGRELQDTFYIKTPEKSDISSGEKSTLVENVKRVHQDGGDTGSTGWGYSWDKAVAEKNVLRTHTTAATCRHLVKAAKEGKFPVKVFCIDRVYRNEAIDYKHLAEFHQVEGIIIDDDCTFQDLIGMLKIFYSKLGFTDIRITPSFFPYTEPSAQVEVFDPVRKEWLELGGCGMFRQEVTRPLGIKQNVAAWGQGLERLIMSRDKLSDMRTLYRNDLDWIRKERN
ncbi:MAG: phenylalanine--tRNA ligase subunit alpha [Candidatus Omnitrophica bacterium]|nr:phenylalanine--tRNA ligase subunit alpha [Candidatus Omnitrophota bacterium]